MPDFNLPAIAAELNEKAKGRPIGRLQEIRKELKKLKRRPGKDIFRVAGDSKTVFPTYAFHFGGRTELQFNIGEDGSDGTMLRYGVGFSFRTDRTLLSLDELKPKVRLFNEFLLLYPEMFAAKRMWHWERDERSDEYMPSPIPPERIKEDVFVFLGKRQPIDQLDCDLILSDFDGLLPLYQYVLSNGESPPFSMPTAAAFSFRAGCKVKASSTVATLLRNQFEIDLRHNVLQERLHKQLASQLGAENVGTELPSGLGTRLDVVVRRPEGYWFYEIKTYNSPRACIREALGQLLEYAFWPPAQEALRLIVVGEPPLDQEGEKYLQQLRTRFAMPIHYEQFVCEPDPVSIQ